MFKILSSYICFKKYMKCNIWWVALRPSYIYDAWFLKVNGRCVVSIPNTFYTKVNMQIPEVHLEQYEADLDENIRCATKSNDESKRIKLLNQRLRLDHTTIFFICRAISCLVFRLQSIRFKHLQLIRPGA
jgi:hypothetical protein